MTDIKGKPKGTRPLRHGRKMGLTRRKLSHLRQELQQIEARETKEKSR